MMDTLPGTARTRWNRVLASVAAQPLELCPDFPTIAQRHEAFWTGDLLDRPLFLGTANKTPDRPITRRLELLHDPDGWFAAKQEDLRQTHFVGDTIPSSRLDLGPVALAALMGAETTFVSDTSWTQAFINDDWSNAPDWCIDEAGWLWSRWQELGARLAEDAAGRYLVMLPNLGSAADVLLITRGSAELCMDLLSQADRITSSIEAIQRTWLETFNLLHEIVFSRGAGVIEVWNLWSNVLHVPLECDFNALVGPKHFNPLLLPEARQRASVVGRAIFHVDGPDAARHYQAILDTPEITVMNYTVGAGNDPMDRIDMLRAIQQQGRPLHIACAAQDLLPLCDALGPERLCFHVGDAPNPQALDALYVEFSRRYV